MKNINQYTVEDVLELLWKSHVDGYTDAYPNYSRDSNEYEEDFWFDSKEQAYLYAEEILNFFQSFDNPFPVYRTIAIGKWKDLDYDDLGNHWSFDRESAINFAKYNTSGNVIISGMVYKEDVDWEQTIEVYEQFSGHYSDEDENEIYIPNASDVIQIQVEPFTGTKLQEMILNEVYTLEEGVEEIDEIGKLAKFVTQQFYDDVVTKNDFESLILTNKVNEVLGGRFRKIALEDVIYNLTSIHDFPKIADFIVTSDIVFIFVIDGGSSSAAYGQKRKNKGLDNNEIIIRFGDIIWENILITTLYGMDIDVNQVPDGRLFPILYGIRNHRSDFDKFKKILKDVFLKTETVEFITRELQHAYDDYVSKGKFAKDKSSKKYYTHVLDKIKDKK